MQSPKETPCPACYGRGIIPSNLPCGECRDDSYCAHTGQPCPHGCPDPDPIPF